MIFIKLQNTWGKEKLKSFLGNKTHNGITLLNRNSKFED